MSTEDTTNAAGSPVERPVSPQWWGSGQFVVVATFRYCLGRQTYVVQECADFLVRNWHLIESPVRDLIRRELERAFERDDEVRAGAQGYKPLGWDCDREQWERVRSLWANVGAKRAAEGGPLERPVRPLLEKREDDDA